jgi:two-component system NtrC family sensor kinase
LKFLTDSQDELTRCSRIIKNLLDFSRQSHPKLSPVNLGSILNESFSILDYRAKLQDIEVVQHIDPGLPNIQADADQLKQVFLNLILNAIQAMHQGGRLTIRATKADEVEEITKNLKAVRIDIEDTGCGIAEENIDKVFTPFFTTKKEEEGGVGLGLAVAYGLVKRHGGDIRVVSSREKGATFSVFLRCQEEQEKVNDGGSA